MDFSVSTVRASLNNSLQNRKDTKKIDNMKYRQDTSEEIEKMREKLRKI